MKFVPDASKPDEAALRNPDKSPAEAGGATTESPTPNPEFEDNPRAKGWRSSRLRRPN